ncbi:hypothetical protein AB6A40_001382 [Gnathostoma spinigerum]|uniref:Vomeronasal type-1 receptor n=1 Tax=Gnathostoma spinigerum TaxID=75299 RepID=A0ABD6E476_9BILA
MRASWNPSLLLQAILALNRCMSFTCPKQVDRVFAKKHLKVFDVVLWLSVIILLTLTFMFSSISFAPKEPYLFKRYSPNGWDEALKRCAILSSSIGSLLTLLLNVITVAKFRQFIKQHTQHSRHEKNVTLQVFLLSVCDLLIFIYWRSKYLGFKGQVPLFIANLLHLVWIMKNPIIYLVFNRALRKAVALDLLSLRRCKFPTKVIPSSLFVLVRISHLHKSITFLPDTSLRYMQ